MTNYAQIASPPPLPPGPTWHIAEGGQSVGPFSPGEAIISGLPVIATEVCGYAYHVEKADVGRVLYSPFSATKFAGLIQEVLTSPDRQRWQANGVNYSKANDLYSMHEKAVEIIENVGQRKGH